MSAGPQEERLQLRDGALHAVRAGSSADPDLLFLHAGQGPGPWNEFYDRLAADYRVLIPDHPGFGASDDFPGLVDVAGLADLYAEVVRAAELDRPIIVGVSFGGWIAAELASKFPEVTDVLVLLSPVGLSVPGAPYADIFTVPPAELAPRLFHDPAFVRRLPEPTPAAARASARNRATLERFARSPLLHDPGLGDRLGRVDARTAVIWPESDRIVPLAVAEGFAERIPRASLELVPDYGHALYNERPQPLADLVVASIERLRKG